MHACAGSGFGEGAGSFVNFNYITVPKSISKVSSSRDRLPPPMLQAARLTHVRYASNATVCKTRQPHPYSPLRVSLCVLYALLGGERVGIVRILAKLGHLVVT